MAQATNPKIEELRFRLKTDPKSRLFYQLAEELRRAAEFDEAEQVLRLGLESYPTYLAAWVILGRVLREQKKEREAVDALNKALQLDPGNAVAARLIADSWMALGEKVEAIKKYKLAHALMPSDENVRNMIEQLEQELESPIPSQPVLLETGPTESTAAGPAIENARLSSIEIDEPPAEEALNVAAEPAATAAPGTSEAAPFGLSEPWAGDEEPAATSFDDSPENETVPSFLKTVDEPFAAPEEEPELATLRAEATRDEEPMQLAHEQSPFEEPVEGAAESAIEVESPLGISIQEAPPEAAVPLPVEANEDAAGEGAFPPSDREIASVASVPRDAGDTQTMADLYVRQGLVDDAAKIYGSILERDPGNDEVRRKLAAIRTPIDARDDVRIRKLESWLSRVAGKEGDRV